MAIPPCFQYVLPAESKIEPLSAPKKTSKDTKISITDRARMSSQLSMIQNGVLDFYLPQQIGDEKKIKFRKYVHNTSPNALPLVPPHRLLPPGLYKFIQDLRDQSCLDDWNHLATLWTMDVFRKFDILKRVQKSSVELAEVEPLIDQFARLSLILSLTHSQSQIEFSLTKDPTLFLFEGETVSKLSGEIDELVIRLEIILLKVIGHMSKLETALKKNQNNNLIPEYQKRIAHESPARFILESIISSLRMGMKFWNDPYYRNYLQDIRLGYLAPKLIRGETISDIRYQFNLFVEMIQKSWKTANDKKSVSLIPQKMFTVTDLKIPDEVEDYLKMAQHLRPHLAARITALFPTTIFLHTQCMSNQSVSLEEIQKELGFRTLDSKGEEIKSPEIDITTFCKHAWILGASSNFIKANQDLLKIQRYFEEVVCKKEIPNFYSFYEPSVRLNTHMMRSLGSPHSPFIVKQAKNTFNGTIAPFYEDFRSNLSSLIRDIEGSIRSVLPKPAECAAAIKQYQWVRKTFDDPSFPPVLAQTLQPFKQAIIYLTTKGPEILSEAHKVFLERTENYLKTVDPALLEDERDALLEAMQADCFSECKNLLELWVTLQEMHLMLLSPEEASEDMAKGMHLIPIEFVNFLDPQPFTQMVDAQIEQESADSLPLVEQIGSLIKNDQILPTELPPLRYSSDSRILEILGFLEDTRHFKLSEGEPLEKTYQRLIRLGVVPLRWKGKNSCVLGHPATTKTLTISLGALSPQTIKDLEKWVNTLI